MRLYLNPCVSRLGLIKEALKSKQMKDKLEGYVFSRNMSVFSKQRL